MRFPSIAVGVLLVLALTACSSSLETNGSESGQTSPEPVATMGSSLCETATSDSIDLLDAALDRVERATTTAEIESVSDSIVDLFSQAGTAMGTNCAGAEAGAALSQLIVWASDAASSRPPVSASYAGGFLSSVCELEGVDLTPSAQVACAG